VKIVEGPENSTEGYLVRAKVCIEIMDLMGPARRPWVVHYGLETARCELTVLVIVPRSDEESLKLQAQAKLGIIKW
jgi:hypothetical protein